MKQVADITVSHKTALPRTFVFIHLSGEIKL